MSLHYRWFCANVACQLHWHLEHYFHMSLFITCHIYYSHVTYSHVIIHRVTSLYITFFSSLLSLIVSSLALILNITFILYNRTSISTCLYCSTLIIYHIAKKHVTYPISWHFITHILHGFKYSFKIVSGICVRDYIINLQFPREGDC